MSSILENEYETYISWERPASDVSGLAGLKDSLATLTGTSWERPVWEPLEQLKQEIKSHNQDMLDKLRNPLPLDAFLSAMGKPQSLTDVLNQVFPRQTATDLVSRLFPRQTATDAVKGAVEGAAFTLAGAAVHASLMQEMGLAGEGVGASLMRAMGCVPVTRRRLKTPPPATTTRVASSLVDAPEPPKKRGRPRKGDGEQVARFVREHRQQYGYYPDKQYAAWRLKISKSTIDNWLRNELRTSWKAWLAALA